MKFRGLSNLLILSFSLFLSANIYSAVASTPRLFRFFQVQGLPILSGGGPASVTGTGASKATKATPALPASVSMPVGASTASIPLDNLSVVNGVLIDSNGTQARVLVIDNKTWAGNAITPQYGGTGISTYKKGDIIYATTKSDSALEANVLSTLPALEPNLSDPLGFNTVLALVGGVPKWQPAIAGPPGPQGPQGPSGGGGGGAPGYAYSLGNTNIYPAGANGTSGGTLTVNGSFAVTSASTFSSTLGVTSLSTFSGGASTTVLSLTQNFLVNGMATTTSAGNISTQGTLNVTQLTTLGNASTTNIGSTGSAYFATSGGSVGIGTTSPYARLTVHALTSDTSADQLTPLFAIASSTPTATSTLFIVTRGGKVGIGTTTPLATLGIQGSIGINSSQLYLAANNDVGIGTSTPASQLNIAGSGGGVGVALTITDNDGAVDNKHWTIGNNAGTLGFTTLNNTQTTLTTRMAISNGGNVGIGTTTPNSLLNIYGADPKLYISNSSGGLNGKHWFLQNTGDSFNIGTTTDALNGDSTYFTIDKKGNVIVGIDGGRVGIGTSTPNANLSIMQPNGNPAIEFGYNNNGGSHWLAGVEGGGNGSFMISSTYDPTSMVDFARLVIASSTGNVGVASSTPWQTFSVTGGVAFSGLATGAGNGALCLSTGGLVSYQAAAACTVSSQRFKNNIQSLSDGSGLREIMAMRPVSFRYNEGAGDSGLAEQLGFIAEEMNLVDPRLVVFEGTSTVPYSVQYQTITAILTKAVQEQQAQIDNLSNLISASGNWKLDSSGVLVVTELKTNKLCIGATCIDEAMLQAILKNSGVGSAEVSHSSAPVIETTSVPDIVEQVVSDAVEQVGVPILDPVIPATGLSTP